jgi:hypothetical protein
MQAGWWVGHACVLDPGGLGDHVSRNSIRWARRHGVSRGGAADIRQMPADLAD